MKNTITQNFNAVKKNEDHKEKILSTEKNIFLYLNPNLLNKTIIFL